MKKKIYEKDHLRSDFRKKKEYLLRAEIEKIFFHFLVQMKSAKSPFEIN